MLIDVALFYLRRHSLPYILYFEYVLIGVHKFLKFPDGTRIRCAVLICTAPVAAIKSLRRRIFAIDFRRTPIEVVPETAAAFLV